MPEDPRRLHLGHTLRRLRRQARYSQGELADAAGGWSQSRVSRLEKGETRATIPDLLRWLDLTEATSGDRARVLELAEALSSEVTAWRQVEEIRGLPAMQTDWAHLEAGARLIQVYNPVLLPGLLQTAEYTRRLLSLTYDAGQHDIVAAVAARQIRQELLYDTSRRIEIVVADTAIRWHLGADVRAGEVDRLRSLMSLEHVTIGLLNTDGPLPGWNFHAFTILDKRADSEPPVVNVESLHSGQTTTHPEDVRRYREAFAKLRDAALTGVAARDLLDRLARG